MNMTVKVVDDIWSSGGIYQTRLFIDRTVSLNIFGGLSVDLYVFRLTVFNRVFYLCAACQSYYPTYRRRIKLLSPCFLQYIVSKTRDDMVMIFCQHAYLPYYMVITSEMCSYRLIHCGSEKNPSTTRSAMLSAMAVSTLHIN